MAEKKRMGLTFSLAAPHQREAWDILRSLPDGQRTDAVCRMICRAREQDHLLESIRAVIREELGHISFIQPIEKTEQAAAGDISDDVLGFLSALQEEGDENP